MEGIGGEGRGQRVEKGKKEGIEGEGKKRGGRYGNGLGVELEILEIGERVWVIEGMGVST